MAGRREGLAILLSFFLCPLLVSASFVPPPPTKSELVAAKNLFTLQDDGSFGSFEATYQAVRVYEVADRSRPDLPKTCSWLLSKTPESVSAIFFAVKTAGILNCEGAASLAKKGEPILLTAAKDSTDLLPLYYSLVGLSYIKEKGWSDKSYSEELSETFDKLQTLAYGDGTWRYSSGQSSSTAKAGGLALEAGAALVSLGVSLSSSQERKIKSGVTKLFKNVAGEEGKPFLLLEGPGDETSGGSSSVAATSAAVKGAISLASVLNLQLSGEVIEASNFLLAVSPSVAFDAFYQLDGLSLLNDNKVIVPLVLQWPTTVSVTSKTQIETTVTTVLGDSPPSVSLKLAGGKGLEGKDFVKTGENTFALDIPAKTLSKMVLVLEISSPDPKYTTGDTLTQGVKFVGVVKVTDATLAILDHEGTNPESEVKLVFGESSVETLQASHLQNLLLSFKLTDPFDKPFKPQQVLVKFTHLETGVKHLFTVEKSGDTFSLKLEFLKMMGDLYYLSGIYSVELTVGDSLMENSFSWILAEVDLDLPEAPSSATKVPEKPLPLESRFGAKPEIHHIFRVPEKRPPLAVSYAFTALSLLPLLGFIFGLLSLGVNLKGLPSSGPPVVAVILFHGGIASIIVLYVMFWFKLNLFFTLKALIVLGLLTTIPGHFALSYLADFSAKQKTA